MFSAIQQYVHIIKHLVRLVPGRYQGLVEVDGLVYEIWRTHTVELIPHVG